MFPKNHIENGIRAASELGSLIINQRGKDQKFEGNFVVNGKLVFAERDKENNSFIRVYSTSGELLREVQVDFTKYRKLFKEDKDRDRFKPTHKYANPLINGIVLLNNGRLIFNIEYEGMVCLDKNDSILWTRGIFTHHSINMGLDSSIWVCGGNFFEKSAFKEECWGDENIINLTLQNGEIIKKWSIRELFLSNGKSGHAFPNSKNIWDPFHINDVEPYTLSDSAGLFSKDDILISVKNLHMVLVLNIAKNKITHLLQGGFQSQHDPDFLSGNEVSIFDNCFTSNPTLKQRSSRVVKLDVNSDHYSTIFHKSDSGESNFTNWMGRQQSINDSLLLVTYSVPGQAILVNLKNNQILWKHNNLSDKGRPQWIYDCIYYPN
ncbi:MAG: hypothetical protein JXQ87_10425 [Bacteroidia bacterium]